MKRSRLLRWVGWLLLACAAYVGMGLFLRDTAGRMLFLDCSPTYWVEGDYLWLATDDGVRIAALDLPNPSARYTVLYLHGNGSELGRDRPFLEAIRSHGYAVLAIDYRGYGCSEGSSSESGLYADAQAALDYLRAKRGVPLERIIVYGYSLGGGPAVELAAREPVAGLILQSAFSSVFAVKSDFAALAFAPFDLFCNRAKIGQVHCPVLLMHGRADGVVPFAHGERLYTAALEPKRAVWVAGAGHGDITHLMGARYWDAIDEFVRTLPAPSRINKRMAP